MHKKICSKRFPSSERVSGQQFALLLILEDYAMQRCLSENDRNELVKRLSSSHETISGVYDELRKIYASKVPAVKTAAKAERILFQLRRELVHLDLENLPRKSLPLVKKGNTVIDSHDL